MIVGFASVRLLVSSGIGSTTCGFLAAKTWINRGENVVVGRKIVVLREQLRKGAVGMMSDLSLPEISRRKGVHDATLDRVTKNATNTRTGGSRTAAFLPTNGLAVDD